MNSLIEVFRMSEVSKEARARIIVALGKAINNEHGANLTEELVFELVLQLDPSNFILTDPHYLSRVTKTPSDTERGEKGV